MVSPRLLALPVAAILSAAAVACGFSPAPVQRSRRSATNAGPARKVSADATTPRRASDRSAAGRRWVTRRPAWLGERVLPRRPDGFGEIRPTPGILRRRRLPTIDVLPPPRSARFSATIRPVPRPVVERSTWRPNCPVSIDELSYVTMSFWGFDHETHTGEMLVNASVAQEIVGVFKRLFESRFPIEEMRVVTREEQHAPPTGDTNNTSSFVCRPVTLGSTWSEHSYGLAVDVNPFQNPYARGDLVAPERALAYVSRTWRRPGMVFEGDVATKAFAAIGWGWGGRWSSLRDWMHFSQSGH
jgi:hypothetical protein